MNDDLVGRLDVIERMLEEGRRTIERWAWVYVLWGVGHVLGVVASFTLPAEQMGLAWAGLMSACGITMAVFVRRVAKRKPPVEQRSSRALDAVWLAFVMMLIFLITSTPRGPSLSTWFAVFSAAYGGAFFATGHIVKWTPAKLNGLAWWLAAVAMNQLDSAATLLLFGAMALVGEIGFGVWAMAHERKVLAGGR